MPPQLSLHFLGSPQIYLNNESVIMDRRKAVALLAYLALEGGPQTRDFLSALFWPDFDQSKAFANLRHTLWELQQTIGEGLLINERESIGFDPNADLSVDVQQFEDLLSKSFSQEKLTNRVSYLSDAVKLYRNHFLSGFSLKDAPEFNEWAFAQSEELRRRLSQALITLSEAHRSLGQAEQAIPYARRLITLDPLNESFHRQLMQVYMQAGQHSAALKQYQACEQILRKELGMDPQPETRDLYKKIRKREIKPLQVEKQEEKSEPPHNLPLPLSSFIGREKEQDEIIDLLAKKRHVTLLGAGGIGKTRLSLQVGRQLLNSYPNGVWFIALDSLSDPALITQTVASVFDIREGGDRSLHEKITDSLRSKIALLIFDNCEHLLDACTGLITALLTDCPNIKVLATSRESLGILGEANYNMPALPLPKSDTHSLEEISDFESIQLFTERASLTLTSFILTQENIQAVVEVCRKLDGIPLAIELAAARVNILQVEEIVAQLQDSFTLLASDIRGSLPRHQTLQASLEWSWGLLSEAEQILLRQLSVFAGGWTLEAARAVCDGAVLDLSGALVKKSLIVVNQELGRDTRYRFHEMVRAFAHEKLVKSGEEEKIRTRHLKYFVNLAEKAQAELFSSTRIDWMERLNDERNNLRAALHWTDQTNTEAGLVLSSRLMRYWESCNLPEGRQWLETFLQKEDAKNFPLAQAYAVHAQAWLLTWLQNFDQAYTMAEECLATFRAAGDRQSEVDALLLVANILQFKYELDTAQKIGMQALALARSLGDTWREANALFYLGWDTRDYERIFDNLGKAISLYRKVGDQVSLANTLGVMGQFRVFHGDVDLGETYIDEAMRLWQANKRANMWENPKIVKSLIRSMRGEYEQAAAMLQEVMTAAKETGNIMLQLWAEVRLGYVSLRSGNLGEARLIFNKTAHRFAEDHFIIGSVFALEGISGLYMTIGKPERAARLVGWADLMRQKLYDPRPNIEQAYVDQIIAACLTKMGEAAFSDMYEKGQKMSLDEALAFAFEKN